MYRRGFIILLIAVLLFITIKPQQSYANPAAVAAGAVAVGALGAGAAAALEGVRGVQDAPGIFEKTKVVYDSIDSAKKAAYERLVSEAISSGVTTVNLTADAIDFINKEFLPAMTDTIMSDYDFGLTEQDIDLLGLIMINYVVYSYDYKFVVTHQGKTFFVNDIRLARSGGGNPPYFEFKAGGNLLAKTTTRAQYDALYASYISALESQDIVPFYNLVLQFCASFGVSIGFQDAPIDNWAEEVERLLQNAFEHAASAGLALNLVDVVGLLADGARVKWDPLDRVWKDTKGIPIAPDVPITNVHPLPRSEPWEETENPSIPANPAIPENPSLPRPGESPITVPVEEVVVITSLATFFEAIRAKINAKYPLIPSIIDTYNVKVNTCTRWESLNVNGLKVGNVTLGKTDIVDSTYINGITPKIKSWVGGIIWFFLGLYIIRKVAMIWGSTR